MSFAGSTKGGKAPQARRLVAILFVLFWAGWARSESPYYAPASLKGAIFLTAESVQPIYLFEREAKMTGDRVEVRRDFFYPDHRLAARENVRYEGDNLVSISWQDFQAGGRASAVIKNRASRPGKIIEFEYQKGADSGVKREKEILRPDVLVGDMVVPFLYAHWDALLKGATVPCRIIALERQETVGFEFRLQAEGMEKNRPTMTIVMKPSNVFISALVDPIYFILEREGERRILRYVGRTTPKIKKGNKWKDLDAISTFEFPH